MGGGVTNAETRERFRRAARARVRFTLSRNRQGLYTRARKQEATCHVVVSSHDILTSEEVHACKLHIATTCDADMSVHFYNNDTRRCCATASGLMGASSLGKAGRRIRYRVTANCDHVIV